MRTTSCWATCASLLQLCHLAQCQHRCLCRSVPHHHPRRCELGARRQPRQIKCCYAVGAGQGCECTGLCSDPVDSACHHHQPLAYPPSARLSITSTTTTVAPGARVHLPGLLLTTQLCTVHAHVHIHIHTHTITPLCIVYARAQTHTHAHTQTPAHVRVHAVVAPLMLVAGVAGLRQRAATATTPLGCWRVWVRTLTPSDRPPSCTLQPLTTHQPTHTYTARMYCIVLHHLWLCCAALVPGSTLHVGPERLAIVCWHSIPLPCISIDFLSVCIPSPPLSPYA